MRNFNVVRCKCGGDTEVVDSRLRKSGVQYRRRVCTACKVRTSTVEVPAWYVTLVESNLKLTRGQ